MRIIGIIAEFNPFHNGHGFHLSAAKDASGSGYIVVAMSGNFVQRGEPALCDKWMRTHMALLNGADLVIEIPVLYATTSAAYFARAAVSLLHSTGIVDGICFGSETGEIDGLMKIGQLLANEPRSFGETLHDALRGGLSFPVARARAVARVLPGLDGLLSKPNNTLGVEYIKAVLSLRSGMALYTVKRKTGDAGSRESHNTGGIASAQRIRRAVYEGDASFAQANMPLSAYSLLADDIKSKTYARLENLSDAFQYVVRTSTKKQLSGILDMDEGLENRFVRNASLYRDLASILSGVKTKRYAYTHLQRAVLHVILGITKSDIHTLGNDGDSPYIRVLGFRRESSSLLGLMHQRASLPILVGLKNADGILSPVGRNVLENEVKATDIYALAKQNGIPGINKEYAMPLVII